LHRSSNPRPVGEESQGDSVLQPRVARNEPPWEKSAINPQLRRSCAITRMLLCPKTTCVRARGAPSPFAATAGTGRAGRGPFSPGGRRVHVLKHGPVGSCQRPRGILECDGQGAQCDTDAGGRNVIRTPWGAAWKKVIVRDRHLFGSFAQAGRRRSKQSTGWAVREKLDNCAGLTPF
jgi:hypothetical protein